MQPASGEILVDRLISYQKETRFELSVSVTTVRGSPTLYEFTKIYKDIILVVLPTCHGSRKPNLFLHLILSLLYFSTRKCLTQWESYNLTRIPCPTIFVRHIFTHIIDKSPENEILIFTSFKSWSKIYHRGDHGWFHLFPHPDSYANFRLLLYSVD